MKKALFYIAAVGLLICTSCTTDEYDTETGNSSVINQQNTEISLDGETVDSTQPIIIPKKD